MPSVPPTTLTGALSISLLEDFLKIPAGTEILIFDYLHPEYMERVDTSKRPEHIDGTSVPKSRRRSQIDALFRLSLKREECGYVYVMVNKHHESEDRMIEMLIENFSLLLDSEYSNEITYRSILPPLHQIVVCPSRDGEGLDIHVREIIQLPNPDRSDMIH